MNDSHTSQLPEKVSASPSSKMTVWFLLTSAFLASVAGSVIVGQIGNLFKMPPDFVDMPLAPSPEYLAHYNAAISEFHSRNYAIHFAIVGALLGLAIGMTGPTKNRLGSAAVTSINGAIAAAIGGFLLGLSGAYCVQVNHGESINLLGVIVEPIVQTTALQCFVWVLIGIGIGIGWTLVVWGPKRILNGIEGGLIGGLLAGVINSMFAASFFSGSSAFSFIPEKLAERIVWAAIGGSSICLGLIYSVVNRLPKESGNEKFNLH
ncbi:MAG TPA: hypothetical protein VM260_07485 [Pirellula sp.]|nr:hypothetical protein [Pirellula sp.]